jgi:hypothetical protein
VLNRFASGTLYVARSSSPLCQARLPFRNMLLAWPVPVALRQREQWQ